MGSFAVPVWSAKYPETEVSDKASQVPLNELAASQLSFAPKMEIEVFETLVSPPALNAMSLYADVLQLAVVTLPKEVVPMVVKSAVTIFAVEARVPATKSRLVEPKVTFLFEPKRDNEPAVIDPPEVITELSKQ